MIKKAIVGMLYLGGWSAMAQNQAQQLYMNNNLANQAYVQQRSNVVLASNVSKVKATNSNVSRAAARPTVQRKPVQQIVQRNINPPVQIMNNAVQVQMTVAENNIGNTINNFEMIQIQQLSNVAIPAIPQAGNASMELNLPKVNLAVKRNVSQLGKHNQTKKIILKVNNAMKKAKRKWAAKFELKKKLRLKVDKCFKF